MRFAGLVITLALFTPAMSGCLTLAAYQMGQDSRRAQIQGGQYQARMAIRGEPVSGTVVAGPLTCATRRVRLISDRAAVRRVIEERFGLQPSEAADWRELPSNTSVDWPWRDIDTELLVHEGRCGRDGVFRIPEVLDGHYWLMAEVGQPTRGGSDGLILTPVLVKGAARRFDIHLEDNARRSIGRTDSSRKTP